MKISLCHYFILKFTLLHSLSITFHMGQTSFRRFLIHDHNNFDVRSIQSPTLIKGPSEEPEFFGLLYRWAALAIRYIQQYGWGSVHNIM